MGSEEEDDLHEVTLMVQRFDISKAALGAFSTSGGASKEFLSQLLEQSWDWRKESREAYVKRVTELVETACSQKEDLIRGYGGNVTYAFEALYGRKA